MYFRLAAIKRYFYYLKVSMNTDKNSRKLLLDASTIKILVFLKIFHRPSRDNTVRKAWVIGEKLLVKISPFVRPSLSFSHTPSIKQRHGRTLHHFFFSIITRSHNSSSCYSQQKTHEQSRTWHCRHSCTGSTAP